MAIDEVLSSLDKLYYDFLSKTPKAIVKAAVFGRFGKLITWYGITTNFVEYITETTRLVSNVVKVAIGVTIALNYKNPAKLGLLFASAAIGHFYPELLLFYAQKGYEAKIRGNVSTQKYYAERFKSYAGLYFDVGN